jgi:DNA-binding MarR family transcriptional regulator
MDRMKPARAHERIPEDADYRDLLAVRTGLRRFLRWSQDLAAASGLTPAQHQLMLAIRGHSDQKGPTIRELADYLLLRHHSVVGLVDRAVEAGLVRRERDAVDHRAVRVRLTRSGAERIQQLSAMHLEELDRLADSVRAPWRGIRERGSHQSESSRVTEAGSAGDA